MMEYNVNPNTDVFLRLQLSINDTGLYPRAIIYAIDDPTTVIDTVDLTELSNGLYGKKWTNNGERKKYFTQTIVYTDSGHTTVHPIIRPDSDSINVGYSVSGGVFGSRGKGTSVQRLDLTGEEIHKIALEVFKLLKPELDKKSEFNVEKDVVKTGLEIPKAKEIAKEIVIPPVEIDPFPPVPSIKEIENVLKKAIIENIEKPKELIDYTEIIKNSERAIVKNLGKMIVDNKTIIPPFKEPTDYSTELSSLDSKLKELAKGSQEDGLINQILRLINLNGDSLEIYTLFRVLGGKEKKLIFNFLAKNNPSLLKELGQIAEAEKIIAEIKSAPDKNWKFNELVSKKRVKSSLIPIINRVANVF